MKRILLIAGFLFVLCATASPQFNGCSAGFCAPSGGASTAFSITAQTPPAAQTTSATSYTFSSVNIGTASASRIVCIGVAYQESGTSLVSSLTIGGTSATQVSGAAATDFTNGSSTDIWCLGVSSGTTANVVVNLTGSGATRMLIASYSIAGTGAAVSTGANTDNTAAGTSTTTSATIPTGGGAIAIMDLHSASIGTVTPTNLTTDNNVVFGGSTALSGKNTSSSGSTTMGYGYANSVTGVTLSIATFSP